MQIEGVLNKRKDIKIHHVLLIAILVLSLILQSYKLEWGLVTDNKEIHGLKAFHISESMLVNIGYRLMQTGDLNPHFFDEPSLFYNSMRVVFTIISKIVDIHSFTQYVLIARIMAVLFTIGVVFLVYLIGKEVGGITLGLYASLLMAINPFYLWFSSIAKEDPMMVFLVALATYLFVRYLSTKNHKDFLLTMAAAGFAASTKYPAGMMLPFLLLLYFMYNGTISVKKRLKMMCKPLAVYILAFVAGTPSSLLSTNEFLRGAIGEFKHYTTTHFGFDHFTFFVHVQTISGLWDAHNIWGKNGYGLILLPLLIGFFKIAPRLKHGVKARERYIWYLLVGWIALTIIVFGFLIKIKMGNHLMIMAPAAMVVAGLGFEQLLLKLPSIHLRRLVGSIIILLIFTYAASGIVSSRNDNRYYAAQWLTANVNPNTSIAATLYVYLPDQFTKRRYLSPISNISTLETSNYDYIILSSWEYERYLDSPQTYPVESSFYQSILDGNTKYRQVAKLMRTETARQRTLNFGLRALTGDEYRGEIDIRIFKRIDE